MRLSCCDFSFVSDLRWARFFFEDLLASNGTIGSVSKGTTHEPHFLRLRQFVPELHDGMAIGLMVTCHLS